MNLGSNSSFPKKHIMTQVQSEGNLNTIFSYNDHSVNQSFGTWQKEQIVEEDGNENTPLKTHTFSQIVPQAKENLRDKIQIEFSKLDQNDRKVLNYFEVQVLLSTFGFTDEDSYRAQLLTFTEEDMIEKVELKLQQIYTLYQNLQAEQYKTMDNKSELIAKFNGTNQILSNLNNRLTLFTIGQFPQLNITDKLISEIDFFMFRFKHGFTFNAYTNAKVSILMTKLRNLTTPTLPEQHLFKQFYMGYDLWDYLYQCEQVKKDQYQKSPTLLALTGSQIRQSFNNQSQLNIQSQYFSQGHNFIYRNNQSSFNPIDGLKNAYHVLEKKSKSDQIFEIYGHFIYDNEGRQDAINACGWSQFGLVREQINTPANLQEFYERMEREQLYLRAAAVALCHFDFAQAIKCLESSLKEEQTSLREFNVQNVQDNERLIIQLLQGFKNLDATLSQDLEIRQMFCFKVEGRTINQPPSEGITSQEIGKYANSRILESTFDMHEILNLNSKPLRFAVVKKSIEFIQVLLQGAKFANPYLMLISKIMQPKEELQKYLVNDLLHAKICIFDKMAIWFRFLPHESLILILAKGVREAIQAGNLDFIAVVGRSEDAVQILRAYLDRTGDIQLSGILASHLYYLEYPLADQLSFLYYEFEQLVNQMQLYELRSKYQIELNEFEKLLLRGKPDLVSINSQQDGVKTVDNTKTTVACRYCKKSLGQAYLESQKKALAKRKTNMQTRTDRARLITCVFCNTSLPQCCICIMSIGIPNIFQEQDKSKRNGPKHKQEDNNSIESAYIWCQTCKHGGHFKHIMDWFRLYQRCPVADCQCECSII